MKKNLILILIIIGLLSLGGYWMFGEFKDMPWPGQRDAFQTEISDFLRKHEVTANTRSARELKQITLEMSMIANSTISTKEELAAKRKQFEQLKYDFEHPLSSEPQVK